MTASPPTEAAPDRAARSALAAAIAWIDAHVPALAAEEITLAEAAGRVLAQELRAAAALPPNARAAIDGIALRAEDTAGAGAYSPVSVRPAPAGAGAPPPFSAALVSAGDPLPVWADAVVPIDQVQRDARGDWEIIEGIAAASGVAAAGSHVQSGATLSPAGREIGPPDIGLLAAAGITRLQAIRRPRVHCFHMRPANASGGFVDADVLLLQGLIRRDGGILTRETIARSRAAIADALRRNAADLVVTVGGTGRGNADEAAAALREAGQLAMHGLALSPGESAGLGLTAAGVPVVLLPGAPAACFWAYELLAGRAVRRRGGRSPAWPYIAREMVLARKLVSAIGVTEICGVRRVSDHSVEPVASFAEAGLGALTRAEGFVVLPEGSEGGAAGSRVTVYFFRP